VSGVGASPSPRQLRIGDEYRLIVHPVVLGRGTPPFTGVTERFTLRHTRTTRLAMGLDILHHEPLSPG
jgi:hypothetical protein